MEKTLSGTIDAVHAVGERLAALQSPAPVPATGLAEAVAAFRAVDGPAAALLRERLTALRPSAGWHGEELDGDVPAEGEWWVCDATDGAVQYLGGLPHWAVTATLVRDGAAVLSVVHAPLHGATYTALRGGGAHFDGQPIAPTPAPCRSRSRPPRSRRRWPRPGRPAAGRESLTAMLGGALAVRNLGPTALQVAQVGAGNLGLFWEYGQDGPNLLPGALIAAEAGAVVTDATGRPWTLPRTASWRPPPGCTPKR
ncbi:inositol monophosphatase family protein [Kitasatospora arboriphila]